MYRRFLSLLTALCVVLGTLPAAMAADAASELGYREEEIALYVSENTEITEDQDGLVVVAASAEVSVKEAKLAVGLLIAPGADGAKVTLGENAEVNAVIVMAASEVVVEETASAVSLVVAAPNVTVEVAGSVEAVAVENTAAGTKLIVAGTAVVNSVTDATGELTVSGPGTANIRIEDKPREENAAGSEDAKPSAAGSASSAVRPGAPAQPEPPVQPETPARPAAPNLTAAPLADQSQPPKTDLYYEGSYGIEVTPDTEAGNVLHVVIKAEDLVKHTAVAGGEEHAWVGLAIPVSGDAGTTYSYYLIRLTSAAPEKEAVTPDGAWTNAGITYDLFYFNTDSFDELTAPRYLLGAVSGGDPLAENVTPEFILELAFEITHAAEEPPADSADAPAVPGGPADSLDPADPSSPEDKEENGEGAVTPETPDLDNPYMPEDPSDAPEAPVIPEEPETPVMPETPSNPTEEPGTPDYPAGDPAMPESPAGPPEEPAMLEAQ